MRIKREPVLLMLAMFPALAGFFAGGIAALSMGAEEKQRIITYFFGNGGYWQVVGAILWKRLVSLGIQAFFCIWIMGQPISEVGGICLQVSWSLPWFCVIRGPWQGVLLILMTLPLSILHILTGAHGFFVSFDYCRRLLREVTRRKSAADQLREGWGPMRKICSGGILMILCALPEAAVFMNMI